MTSAIPGAMAMAALVMSTIALTAQTPDQTSPTRSSNAIRQDDRSVPRHHLSMAARILDGISQNAVQKNARKKLEELRKQFTGLVNAYNANSDPFVPPAVPHEDDLKVNKKAEPVNWKMHLSEVESQLTRILGGGSSLPPSTPAAAGTVAAAPSTMGATTAGTAGQVSPTDDQAVAGTTGRMPQPTVADSDAALQGADVSTGGVSATAVVGEIGIKDLDPALRRQIEEFRLAVELFFASAVGGIGSAGSGQ